MASSSTSPSAASSSSFAMASSSTSEASSSSTPSWKYDVFLSFRGEDTRTNFTDHLHKALRGNGIITFIDDQLRRGEQISPALFQAIEDSRFSIIVFSQNYASSSWCLFELSKILKCVHKGKHTAFPVFCGVDPSHVRHQRGSYAQAFQKHEETHKNKMRRVRKWREALTEASELSGWDTRNRYQSEVIEEIVCNFNKLIDISPSNMELQVGMDSRIQEMLSLLCIGSPDVRTRTVGIWGMAGIGKTTIAKAICQRICTEFEVCCFLLNDRGNSQRNDSIQMETHFKILWQKNLDTRILNGGATSIMQALRGRKVLMVLDDVNHRKQLEELVEHRDRFGPKSWIIITTRDKRLLIEKDENAIYEVKGLLNDEALELFCWHAFKHGPFEEEFKELCHHFLYYSKGNPLALKILGCFLYKRSKKEWESELEKLMKIPHNDIQEVLRISFDGLDDNQKDIFLDIACFFNWKDKSYISEILKSCGFHPEIDITILVEKALITISLHNELFMHDLIQEMGREIVRQESIKDPGKRSRLWQNEDVVDVLTTNTGTETIEAIVLHLSGLKELEFSVDVFTKMIKLRILIFGPTTRHPHFRWEEYLSAPCKMHLRGDFKFLSSNLRCLKWEGYTLKSLPSNFNPRKLFDLNMRSSMLEQLWEGNKPCPNLTYMDLSHSRHLIRTPDFSEALNLRTLDLEGCTSLVEVHSSIGTLEKLSFLRLRGCSKLEGLPKSIGKLTSLKYLDLGNCSELRKLPKDMGTSLTDLILSGCSKLKKLPDDIGSLQLLEYLEGDVSGIQEIPPSISRLTRLELFSLAGVDRFTFYSSTNLAVARQGLRFPSFLGLGSLLQLELSDCNLQEGALPSDMSSLCSLKQLFLSGNGFISLPSLTPLTQLEELEVRSCKSLKSLTELPPSIETVSANDCESLENFSHPQMMTSREWVLDFHHCARLQESVSLEALLRRIPGSIFQDRESWRFEAIVPGKSIPKWFIHRGVGNNSIIVKLPPDIDIADVTRPIGVAFCAILGEGHFTYTKKYNVLRLDSDHIWSGILPIEVRFSSFSCGYDEALSKRTHDNEHPCVSHLKFSFMGWVPHWLVVKKYGIRLFYVPEWNEEMMVNQLDITEFDTVAAISCPRRMVFSKKEHCKRKCTPLASKLIVTGAFIEVKGYHKDVHKSLALPRKKELAETSLSQDPSQSEVLSKEPWWERKPRIAGRRQFKTRFMPPEAIDTDTDSDQSD